MHDRLHMIIVQYPFQYIEILKDIKWYMNQSAHLYLHDYLPKIIDMQGDSQIQYSSLLFELKREPMSSFAIRFSLRWDNN